MPSIKAMYADQDIPFGDNGKVVKAGTRQHAVLVNLMVAEQEEEQEETHKNYIAQIQTAFNSVEGLSEDDFVEAVVIRKTSDGLSVVIVDDERKVSVKKYLKATTS